VRIQPAQPPLLQPLRGEQQVYAQRAAQPSDLEKQLDEVGLGGEQLGELVAHDQQVGQRRPGSLVLADAGDPGAAQQLLAAHDLAVERVRHAVDEREFVGEVGDDSGGVRQPVECRERRPTLVVDQHEVELFGGVRRGQPEHERAQQLGLA
jgi:hypothetical protein